MPKITYTFDTTFAEVPAGMTTLISLQDIYGLSANTLRARIRRRNIKPVGQVKNSTNGSSLCYLTSDCETIVSRKNEAGEKRDGSRVYPRPEYPFSVSMALGFIRGKI
jgi:hypothetical protein